MKTLKTIRTKAAVTEGWDAIVLGGQRFPTRRPSAVEDEYTETTRKLRAARHLHSAVQKRLRHLLDIRHGSSHTVSEVAAIPGGRNDAMRFEFDGRRVCFEIFASVGQVPQDLRLLEQVDADVCIAILLDTSVDPRVADRYFRKKPDAFPYLWVRDILDPSREPVTLARLSELVDEDSSVRRLRALLANPRGAHVEKPVSEMLRKLEAALANQPSTPERPLDGRQVFALLVLRELRQLDIPIDRLRSLYAWLVESAPWALELVALGFQAFLITDLEGRHAIWTDSDLADDLFPGAYASAQAHVVMCLNTPIHKVMEKPEPTASDIKWNLVHMYAELEKVSIPRE